MFTQLVNLVYIISLNSRTSSQASIDSILAAKVAAQREFDRGASTSHDATTYSVAEDVAQTQGS